MTELPPFSTGIPDLDSALNPHLRPGNVILCPGLTGSGKTILAGQFGARLTVAGHSVLFISTEVELPELNRRIHSAYCDIPYADIVDGIHTVSIPLTKDLVVALPDPERYGLDVTGKALDLARAMDRGFAFVESARDDGFSQEIDRSIAEYRERKSRMPDVIIYDYLRAPRITDRETPTVRELHQTVDGMAAVLKAVAARDMILIFAFCQADQTLNSNKKIGSNAIREYKSISNHAHAFIGISNRFVTHGKLKEGQGVRDPVQHLTIETSTGSSPVLVPVIRDFEYQRFKPYDGRQAEPQGDEAEIAKVARTIEKTSEFPAYVLARRAKFRQIFDCGVPYAINLYAFLLLVAKIKGIRAGMSFWGRNALEATIGLTTKRLRMAQDVLEERQMIYVPPGKGQRSLHYQVNDWTEDQKPWIEGYFKLFRNLRDESRRDILGDPVLFRVWLYVLNNTRQFPDEAADLLPGEALVGPELAREKLGLKKGEFIGSLERLRDRGSIRYRHGAEKLVVANWYLYQTVMYPSKKLLAIGAAD